MKLIILIAVLIFVIKVTSKGVIIKDNNKILVKKNQRLEILELLDISEKKNNEKSNQDEIEQNLIKKRGLFDNIFGPSNNNDNNNNNPFNPNNNNDNNNNNPFNPNNNNDNNNNNNNNPNNNNNNNNPNNNNNNNNNNPNANNNNNQNSVSSKTPTISSNVAVKPTQSVAKPTASYPTTTNTSSASLILDETNTDDKNGTNYFSTTYIVLYIIGGSIAFLILSVVVYNWVNSCSRRSRRRKMNNENFEIFNQHCNVHQEHDVANIYVPKDENNYPSNLNELQQTTTNYYNQPQQQNAYYNQNPVTTGSYYNQQPAPQPVYDNYDYGQQPQQPQPVYDQQPVYDNYGQQQPVYDNYGQQVQAQAQPYNEYEQQYNGQTYTTQAY